MKYHALFVTFEKAAKFANVVSGALRVNKGLLFASWVVLHGFFVSSSDYFFNKSLRNTFRSRVFRSWSDRGQNGLQRLSVDNKVHI